MIILRGHYFKGLGSITITDVYCPLDHVDCTYFYQSAMNCLFQTPLCDCYIDLLNTFANVLSIRSLSSVDMQLKCE